MFKNQLKKYLLEALYFCVSYFSAYLFPKIKEAFLESKDEFLGKIWDSIKDDIHAQIKSAIEHVEEYMETAEYELREKEVIDTVFKKVQLPIFLRPFKGLLKKMFRDKLRKLVAEQLKKLDQKI